MSLVSILRLVGCLALCLGVGGISGGVTAAEIPTWYARLVKPFWTPPNWTFPVVWTILYGLMAISLWRLWEASLTGLPAGPAIGLFLVQLALNAMWSPVFFTFHRTGLALVVIVLLAGAIAATIWLAFPVSSLAAWLLAPYLAWVLYATTLNAGILALNR